MKKLLFTKYANRFSPIRKKKFRKAMIDHLQSLGYEPIVDKSILGNNIYFGNIDSDFVFTAHYDTATNMRILYPFMRLFGARYGQLLLLVPIIIIMLFFPRLYIPLVGSFGIILFAGLLIANKYNYNDNTSGVYTLLEHATLNQGNNNFFYALTDNEEKGLFGAKMLRNYLKKHKRLQSMYNINVDCVGVGDKFLIASLNDNEYLQQSVKQANEVIKTQTISSKLLASDHILFGSKGIMITKVNNAKFGNDLYIPNLHSNLDCEFDKSNIDITLEIIKKITGDSN